MKKSSTNRFKKILALVCVLVLVMSVFSSCSQIYVDNDEITTETTTTTTTTETTTTTTTENLDTTFAETSTNKIYSALSKDKTGNYPYKIATYTTYYNSSNETRTANLKAAVSKLNNIKIPSGSYFSFNQTVGKRTVIAGYEEATVIKDGEFVDGLGGGVCQVSSTIFQCVLRANLDIVSRTNHSLEISYVPLGGDATVQWNSTDFKFKNNLSCDVKITMTCENGSLTCTLWAKEDIDVGEIEIKITEKDGKYTLTRYVNGVKNYTTTSKYSEVESE